MKVDLYIHRLLTGHIYFRSPYESCDSCGTCDGGRCDSCHEIWEVTEFDDLGLVPNRFQRFRTKDEAKKYAGEIERSAERNERTAKGL